MKVFGLLKTRGRMHKHLHGMRLQDDMQSTNWELEKSFNLLVTTKEDTVYIEAPESPELVVPIYHC